MEKTRVLLESGTNEIEVMKFTINNELYGINVAKVREIMLSEKVKSVPYSHAAVEGVYKPRDTIFTVIDLPFYLTGIESEKSERDLFIVTNFNQINIAFRVNGVIGIQRLSWEDIEKPDKTLSGKNDSIATGIIKNNTEELVIILDFEKIVADIAPETSIQEEDIKSISSTIQKEEKILIAEDSSLLRRMLLESLARAGYVNVKSFDNGQELWEYLSTFEEDEEVKENVHLIITDIEMPQMDGHRLTKLIKDTKIYKEIPVIIFSSLISGQMRKKGEEVGASAQLSKPEIGRLIEIVNGLLQYNSTTEE